MALVLYHVEDAAKEKQLSALCRELHLTARRLTNADRDRAVAALCGEKVNANVQKAPAGYKLPEVLIPALRVRCWTCSLQRTKKRVSRPFR